MLARFPRLVAISIGVLLLLAWLFRGSSSPSLPGSPPYRSDAKISALQQPEGKLRDTYLSSRPTDPDRVHMADVPDESASATVSSESIAVPTRSPVINRKTPFAYVFWASADIYACAALILLRRLDEFKSPHPAHILIGDGVSQPYRDELEKWNATLHEVEPPKHPSPIVDAKKTRLNETNEMNLMKLHVFRMHQIDPSIKRALIMDADQYLYAGLDTLFTLPEVDLAAPRAYWDGETKNGVTYNLASTLMLVEPNDRLWNKVNDEIKQLNRGEYADTVINRVFHDSAMVLPGPYAVVDDHWYNWWMPSWYRPEDTIMGKGMIEEYQKGEMKEIWRIINLHVNDPHDEAITEEVNGNVNVDSGMEDAAAAAAPPATQKKKRSLVKRQEDAEAEESAEDEEVGEDEGDLDEVTSEEEAETGTEKKEKADTEADSTEEAEEEAEEDTEEDTSAESEEPKKEMKETTKEKAKADTKNDAKEDAKKEDASDDKEAKKEDGKPKDIAGAGNKPPSGDEPTKEKVEDSIKFAGLKDGTIKPTKEEMIKLGLLKGTDKEGHKEKTAEEVEAAKKKEQEEADKKKKEEAELEKAREERKKQDEANAKKQSENRKEAGPKPHTVEDHPDKDALTRLHSQIKLLKFHSYGKPWDRNNPGMRKDLEAIAHKRLMDQNKDWREKAQVQCPKSPRRKNAHKEPEMDEDGNLKEQEWENWHPVIGV